MISENVETIEHSTNSVYNNRIASGGNRMGRMESKEMHIPEAATKRVKDPGRESPALRTPGRRSLSSMRYQ